MAEFNVELIGGPHAGRRALKSRRRQPPEEIPVLVEGGAEAGHEMSAAQTAPKTFAVYRYSHRDTETETLVYSYAHDRNA